MLQRSPHLPGSILLVVKNFPGVAFHLGMARSSGHFCQVAASDEPTAASCHSPSAGTQLSPAAQSCCEVPRRVCTVLQCGYSVVPTVNPVQPCRNSQDPPQLASLEAEADFRRSQHGLFCSAGPSCTNHRSNILTVRLYMQLGVTHVERAGMDSI